MRKQAYIERMAQLYKIDGILYHDSKTCPNNSNNRYGLPQRVQQKLGLPYLVINGDLNDLRMYSEEQTRTNIEAFVEQLLQQRLSQSRAWEFYEGNAVKYYCGIDIGASAAKLAIIDADGRMVAKAPAPLGGGLCADRPPLPGGGPGRRRPGRVADLPARSPPATGGTTCLEWPAR